jgi:CRISPR-associated endoribonuclease Cas6
MNEFKHYNFSGLKGQTRVSKSGLHFYSNKITIVFSCSDKYFLDKVIQEIFLFDFLKVRSLQLKPLSVELEPQVEFSEVMEYICISPLILLQSEFFEDAAKEFIHPNHHSFQTLLKQSLLTKNEQFSPDMNFNFNPDQDYVDRIENSGKKYSRIYPLYDQDIPYEVRGYTLPFTLEAPIDVQKSIYSNGLGLYCEKGFGMVDLANIQPGAETVTYFDGHFVN